MVHLRPKCFLRYGKKRNWIAIFCCLGVALSFSAALHGAEPALSLLPDLSFHFVCTGRARTEIETKIETLLAQYKFKVLNQGELQRQHDVHLFGTSIAAYEGNQRFVDVRSVTSGLDRYSFDLYSLPPTSHSRDLEESILHFVSENLRCEIRQVERHENDQTHADFFRTLLGRMRRLFEDADRIKGQRKA
jgi:hypothetical protein